MAINIGSNFNYQGPEFLDTRLSRLFQSEADLLEYGDGKDKDLIPEGFEVFVGKEWYTFLPSSSLASKTTGYFHPRIGAISQELETVKEILNNNSETIDVLKDVNEALKGFQTIEAHNKDINAILERLGVLENLHFPISLSITTDPTTSGYREYGSTSFPSTIVPVVKFKDGDITTVSTISLKTPDRTNYTSVTLNDQKKFDVTITPPTGETGSSTTTLTYSVKADYTTDTGSELSESKTFSYSFTYPTYFVKKIDDIDEFLGLVANTTDLELIENGSDVPAKAKENIINIITGGTKNLFGTAAASYAQNKLTQPLEKPASLLYAYPKSFGKLSGVSTVASLPDQTIGSANNDDWNYFEFQIPQVNKKDVTYYVYYRKSSETDFQVGGTEQLRFKK